MQNISVRAAEFGAAVGPRVPGRRSSARVSAPAVAVSVYIFLVVSRLPELAPPLAPFHPIFLTALAVIICLLAAPRHSVQSIVRRPEVRAVLLLFLLAALSVPGSAWPRHSLSFVFTGYVKTVLFFLFLLLALRTIREAYLALWAFVGAIATLAVTAALTGGDDRLRITATYDPNDLAFVMACALPVVAGLSAAKRGPSRWLLIALTGFCTLTIIRTQSRGGLIALVVVGTLTLAFSRSRLLPALAALAIAALLFSAYGSASYWDRMATILTTDPASLNADEYLRGGLWTSRWEIWKRGIFLLVERPVLGVGAGAFWMAQGDLAPGPVAWKNAHNSFIQVGAELGVVGLAAFLFLISRAISNCRAVIRSHPVPRSDAAVARGLELALYGYAVAGFALSQGYSDILYFLVAISSIFRFVVPERGGRSSATTSRPSVPSGVWWRRRASS